MTRPADRPYRSSTVEIAESIVHSLWIETRCPWCGWMGWEHGLRVPPRCTLGIRR